MDPFFYFIDSIASTSGRCYIISTWIYSIIIRNASSSDRVATIMRNLQTKIHFIHLAIVLYFVRDYYFFFYTKPLRYC